MAFVNNIAACLFEKKEYNACIDKCSEAIALGKTNRAKFELLGKAYGRKGAAYMKLKQFKEAVAAYEAAQMEFPDHKLKLACREAQNAMKKQEEEGYLDEAKAEESRLKGNKLYEEQKWMDAITDYTEAIKRNPKNHKTYSNRAACFSKLMDWQRALDDCDMCLKLDPTFVKAYIRKGKVQQFLKQYHKALQTFEEGLKLDPKASELVEGRMQVLNLMRQENQTGVSEERAKEAFKDPEIQAILRDPYVTNVLRQMQEDPNSAQAALADPDIREKIDKLVASGVLQMR
jgi:stress-induced-phosphoprotein 1